MPIKFHLPGLRNNFPLNMLTLKMFEAFPDYFRKDIQIASFFGEFPTCLWNGGRYSGDDQCDSGYVRHVIQAINAAGIAVRYTFTNPSITKEDLADPYCNFCMEAGNNGKNEVLVVSPLLEEYIRKNYSSYTINSSTCKEIRSVAALNEELEKDYGLVVLDYNLNNCFDELLKITDKSAVKYLSTPAVSLTARAARNTTALSEPRRGRHLQTAPSPLENKNQSLPGAAGTANRIPCQNTKNIKPMFPRMTYGINMSRWVLKILNLRDARQTCSCWLIRTATILRNRNTTTRQDCSS